MKKLFLFALPLLAITFNSCSKNDNGEDNGNNTPPKLVKNIHYFSVYSSRGSSEWDMAFTYDSQNRISKITDHDDHYSMELRYAYTANSIVHTIVDGSYTARYTLDGDGFVTSWDFGNGPINCTYSNGYIATSSATSYNQSSTTTFTWANGNLIKEDYRNRSYTYTDKENKLNINIFAVIWESLVGESDYFSFKGTTPKNLPASHTYDYEFPLNDGTTGSILKSVTDSITYTLDSDGYPTEIVVTGQKEIGTITISYY